MLSTFLSQLQAYFAKYFVIASLFPMLSFAVLNGLVGYVVFASWHSWIDSNIFDATLPKGTFATTSLVVAVTLLAYVLSELGTVLRQILEGRSWGALGRLLIPSQSRRRDRLIDELHSVAIQMANLKDAPVWAKKMRDAQKTGKQDHSGVPFTLQKSDTVVPSLQTLEIRQLNFQLIETNDLEKIANAIAEYFEKCDCDKSPELMKLQERLIALIEYARDRAPARHAKLQNEINSNFGRQEVAPTKMGNVANSMQSYALRRYHCNLETVWSNLLHVMQKDDKAQAALQEAKTQLDFLVACCWLTLIFAIFWTAVILFVAQSRSAFVVFAIGGPMAAYLWYRAAAEQYRSFADMAMTMFDTFRFDLMREMRLQLPADVEEERWVWAEFDKLATFGEEKNFRYDHPKA